MKRFFAALLSAAAFCLLSACATPNGGSASSDSSGVTVFGTIDAGVSTYRNR